MAESKEKSLNLAFLGCGFATRLHSKTLSGFKNQVGRYYASRNKEKAIAYNRKYKGHGYFDSYDAAINDPNIEVVLIATPPVQHLDLTLQALGSGKHVIVEKPPFLHSTDFDPVRQAQAEAGRRVLVAENYFYKPLAIKLRQIISEGLIGEVRFVHVNALKKQTAEDWRSDASLSGGGALFEGGIHWINFIANLGLRIKRVRGFRPGAKNGLEKSMLVAIEYEEGPVGAFYYSWEIPSLFKGLRLSKIYGTKGSITFESNGIFILVRGKKKRIFFPKLSDIAGYKTMFQDFIQCLREDKAPQFSLDLAQRDLKLIEDIYQSLNH
ncbi:MAG: Gfo/Idh/MocA family protein [bacterium]